MIKLKINQPKNRTYKSVKNGQQVTTTLTFSPLFATIKTENMKKAQVFIDSEVLRLCDPLVPMRSSTLIRSGSGHTVCGSGLVTYNTPYARYMYYGKKMIDPKYGKGAFYSVNYGYWSRPNVKKQLTEIPLKYGGAPIRGAYWFERMKVKHKFDILQGARKITYGK